MKAVISLAMTGTLLLAGAAVADDHKKLEDAIHYRQSVMHVLGWNFGHLGAMAKGDIDYDAEQAGMRADRVKALSEMPWEGFIEGSYRDDGHGIDTEALAKIADNGEDFKARQEKFQDAANKLADVAKNDDFAALRQQVAATGKTCKGCHDEYRADD